MRLVSSTRLGPYEILSYIGGGGMGEVYRAKDTRLDRIVAIKVLPEHLASKPQLRERFEREAHAISGFNHPHICTLHDIGHQGGIDFLVMEYLEGETLDSRLRKGSLPLVQVLRYAIEIAEALDQAHRHGVIHRDLKPSNVMLTKAGAKLLDFGLAKLRGTADTPVAGTLTAPPTHTAPLTDEGAILGTFQYMAPEQLEGGEADARADIFAFGAVVYEITTGRKAFEGKSYASLIAAILEHDPTSITSVQPLAPLALDRVVQTCLAKDPDARWQSVGDLLLELKWIAQEGTGPERAAENAAPRKTNNRFALVGLVLVGVLIGAGIDRWLGGNKMPETPTLRYLTYSGHDSAPAASPDGRTIAFTSDRDGRSRIWLKELAKGGEVALTGGRDSNPRYSPDGSMILFSRAGGVKTSLYRMAIVGGEPRRLVEDAVFGDWSPDGNQIAFVRWSPKGGSSIGLAGAEGERSHEIVHIENRALSHPRWSPDGHTIAAVQLGKGGVSSSIFLVGRDGKNARSVAAPPGGFTISSLAWSGTTDDVVYSQNESVQSATVTSGGGMARVIRQNVKSGAAYTVFRIPHNSSIIDVLGPGQVIFDTRSPRQSLREVPLRGKTNLLQSRSLTGGNSQDRQPAYSPDGEWVIFSSNRSGNMDLWEISTKTGAVRRITDDRADDMDPGFTRDGKRIIWSSNRSGPFEIWIADADGSGARQLTNDGVDAENPTATPDGAWVVYSSGNPSKQGVWKIRQDGSDATRLVPGSTTIPEVSPDGSYATYEWNTDRSYLRVVRIADGTVMPFEIQAAVRSRWWPGGRAIAFIGQDEKGITGVFAQDFIPGEDTTRTRRRLGGFDSEMLTESFGISPDGSHMTISSWEQIFSLMIAERVPGVSPPTRSGQR